MLATVRCHRSPIGKSVATTVATTNCNGVISWGIHCHVFAGISSLINRLPPLIKKVYYRRTMIPEDLATAFGHKAGAITSALYRLRRNAKARARNKGLPFGLTFYHLCSVYLAQGGLCFYSGREMQLSPDRERRTTRTRLAISVDRLNKDEGYVDGNVCLCCCDTNLAKGENSVEEFTEMCKAVATYTSPALPRPEDAPFIEFRGKESAVPDQPMPNRFWVN
jgi:hypothetical protein